MIDCKRERERERDGTRLVVTRAKDGRIQRRKDQQLAMPSEKGYRTRNQPPGSSQTTSSSPNSPQFQWSDKRSDTELVVDEQAYHCTYQLVTCVVCASGAENLDRDAGRAPNAAAASFPFLVSANEDFGFLQLAIGSREEIQNQSPCFAEVSEAPGSFKWEIAGLFPYCASC